MAKATASDTTALSVSEAAGAIVALINSRAQSPWPHEIETIIAKTHVPSNGASEEDEPKIPRQVLAAAPADISPLHAEIKRVAAEYRETCVAADNSEAPDIETNPRMESLRKRLQSLAGQLPQVGTPAMLFPSLADVIAWANVADAIAREEKNGDGWPMLYEGNDDNIAVGNLITAILALEARHSRLPAEIGDGSSLSADHLRYRELVAEIDGFEWGAGLEDEKEREPAFNKLTEQATELEAKVWATPARTLGDVLLRGEIALHNENALMDSLDDPEAYYDERAVAQVIRAVLDVLGGLHAR